MTFPRDNARETFAKLRPLLLGLGLSEQVEKLDQLLVDDRVITSPDSFWHEWEKVFSEAQEAGAQQIASGAEVPKSELRAWLEYRSETAHTRFERNKAKVEQTPRGLIYWMPFLLVQAKQGHDLDTLLRTSPPLRAGAGPDLTTALETNDPELLARSLAKATAHLGETIYKPQLRILWQVLNWLKEGPDADPSGWTLGRLMHKIQKLWTDEQGLPREKQRVPNMEDFLCWDALQVRNTAQHPEKMRYDPETGELVGDDRGEEVRWTEQQLRLILGTLFTKCDVMSKAIVKAAGAFDVPPDAFGTLSRRDSE